MKNIKYISGLNYKWVQSIFDANWKGIILDNWYMDYNTGTMSGRSYMCTVVIIIDKSGRCTRKRKIVNYNVTWFREIEPINIMINKDWTINFKKTIAVS